MPETPKSAPVPLPLCPEYVGREIVLRNGENCTLYHASSFSGQWYYAYAEDKHEVVFENDGRCIPNNEFDVIALAAHSKSNDKLAEHRQRHVLLHQMLDELVADYILHNPTARPSKNTILDLMQWSSTQIKK